jgi:hypothetical protein
MRRDNRILFPVRKRYASTTRLRSKPTPTVYWLPAGMIRTAWTDRRFLDAQGVIDNLANSGTSRDLLEHFSRAGGVLSALAATDRVSGSAAGVQFVEMAEVSDLAVAFALLNNSELQGRRIKIQPEPSLRNGHLRNRNVAS